MLFAAGEAGRATAEQALDSQHVDDAFKVDCRRIARCKAPAIEDVLLHLEMGKQPVVLEHVAYPPLLYRQAEAPGGIQQQPAVQFDTAPVGAQQAGHGVDHTALAGTRGAEQHGNTGWRLKTHVQGKVALRVLQLHIQGHRPAILRATRRARTSESSRAPMAITTETIARRAAMGSPPGTCRKA